MRALLVGLVVLVGCGSKDTAKAGAGSGSDLAQVAGNVPPPAIDAAAPVAGPDKPPVDASDDPAPRDPDPDPGCATTCNKAEDCPASRCECEDGKLITARSCTNNCCMATTATCGGVCDDHDGMKGTWNDQREGGKQTGKSCKTDDDCARKLCYRGYCTRSCESFGDCPPFWECDEVGGGTEKLCVRR